MDEQVRSTTFTPHPESRIDPDIAELLDALAGVLAYPEAGWRARLESCRDRARRISCAGVALLEQFCEATQGNTRTDLEERYINTFDLNPACTLDLGWHLFGEDYNRGLYLVKLRRELRIHGIAETQELPDHLTQALRLLGRMDAAGATDFAASCVMPALEKTIGALPADNPYRGLLEAVMMTLGAAFGPVTEECEHGATA
ncbi:MAG TPA: hypothetical protein PKI11_16635 [Candidatus Hydrogenedentes bacterium]|nr:hypothetical protein [Candidatus Hydrogenedentota bacterium]HNT87505.1 hypothetical protein [Candidatus Hydrogenedentota bacterium]